MEKTDGHGMTDVVATASHHDGKEGLSSLANQQEHNLTLKTVFTNHKAVVWWCFYWAMCAVGW